MIQGLFTLEFSGHLLDKRDSMIESLLDELPPHGGYDEQENCASKDGGAPSETSFLSSLSIVQRIVARRRSPFDSASGQDLVQEVALRIWRWRSKHHEKGRQMSGQDWNAFAARTAYNEVNRQFSRDNNSLSLTLEDITEIQEPSVEGQPEIEVFSLVEQVWQETCLLSLRQRRSLLLHSQELVIYFLQIGISGTVVAELLDLSKSEWNNVLNRIPMSDSEIAKLTESTASSVKKARHDARVKLKGLIRG